MDNSEQSQEKLYSKEDILYVLAAILVSIGLVAGVYIFTGIDDNMVEETESAATDSSLELLMGTWVVGPNDSWSIDMMLNENYTFSIVIDPIDPQYENSSYTGTWQPEYTNSVVTHLILNFDQSLNMPDSEGIEYYKKWGQEFISPNKIRLTIEDFRGKPAIRWYTTVVGKE